MNELDLLDEVIEFLKELYNDPNVFEAVTEEQLDKMSEFQERYHEFNEMQERGEEEYEICRKKLSELRNNYMECALGPTHRNLENKLKAKHYSKEIDKLKKKMKMKGFL